MPSLRLIRELDHLDGAMPRPMAFGVTPRVICRAGAVHRLGPEWESVASRPLALVDGERLLAASPDLAHVAVHSDGAQSDSAHADAALVLSGPGDERTVLAAADDAWFFGDRLLTAGPPADEGDEHRIRLYDLPSGRLLDEAAVPDAFDAAAAIVAHPHERAAMVDCAMGQDGSVLTGVTFAGDRLELTDVLDGQDPVCAGFSPDGTRVLITPHPNDAETARVLSWPELTEAGRVDAAEVPGAELGLGLTGCFVTDEDVVLYAQERSLILTGRDLDRPRVLEAEGLPELGDDADVEWVCAVGVGLLAVGLWRSDRSRRAYLYRLAP